MGDSGIDHDVLSCSLPKILAKPPSFTPYLLTPLDHTLGSKDECVYQPMFYTFRVDNPEESLAVLQEGISRLVTIWPFLAGEIVVSGDGNRLQVQPLGKKLESDNFLTVRHEDREIPDNPSLQGKAASTGIRSTFVSTLDASYRPLPLIGTGTPQCFMRIQANIFQNAIILCMSINHTAVDGTGMGNILQGLAACCRAASNHSCHPHLATDIHQEEAGRKLLLSLPSDSVAKDVSAVYGSLVEDNSKWEEPMPVENTTLYFSPERISCLKAVCNQTLSEVMDDASVKFLSTGDILNALIWVSHCRATEKVGMAKTSTTSAMFPVTARGGAIASLSPFYMGSAIAISRIIRDRQDLCGPHWSEDVDVTNSVLPRACLMTLISLACDFRRAVNKVDSGYFSGVIANVLARQNWNDIRIAHSDLSISNMASDPTYTLEFGEKLRKIIDFDMHGDCFSNLVYIKPRKLEDQSPTGVDAGPVPHEVCLFLSKLVAEAMKVDPLVQWALFTSE
ncbi:hypothetical protein N7493_001293 [Penicillium malachiteum]|uniref:Trichothecene 3-O-acetyltransferase-like N-terminal domain-containing protein n=1 Tax=Penicillium malachiteum TaxID=1324776 RepID=A0AAD6MZT0_9EURO|nr:hypothetical protein N7493_001293 [Penicillium malachiteum]